MKTNDEIMKKHKKHTCNPKAKKGESQLYDEDCVIEMLDEARADEKAKILTPTGQELYARRQDIENATAQQIFKELEETGIICKSHYECDDCWYSCPKSVEGCCNESDGNECNCGVDRLNKLYDEIKTKYIEEM